MLFYPLYNYKNKYNNGKSCHDFFIQTMDLEFRMTFQAKILWNLKECRLQE